MAIYKNISDVIDGYRDKVAGKISGAVKDLLENRHLYQYISVETKELQKEFIGRLDSDFQARSMSYIREAQFFPWMVRDSSYLEPFSAIRGFDNKSLAVAWRAPDIKLYCKKCERLEPFNNYSATCVFNSSDPACGGIPAGLSFVQVYVLSYLCQSCKAIPDVFLVHRLGAKITLVGRAPMEHVEVPRFIPKDISKYFSGARIAHQSGQTLAALFLLRTLCEQWVRKFGGKEDKADVAIEKYMNTLPDDFKARFPSIRDIYGELSAAIHSADPSEELFAQSVSAIEKHFNARSLFELPSP